MASAFRRRWPYSNADWIKAPDEAAWRQLRSFDITATDAAALFGVSPYCTPYELYHRKAGNLDVSVTETDRMRWGKRLQGAIAAGVCEDQGWQILSAHPFQYVRSRRFVGMGASPDVVIYCPQRQQVGLLEVKNVDSRVARDGWEDDEAPAHIEFQLQHQLEAAELPFGAIAGLVGGNEARVIIRDRDTEAGAEIGARVLDLIRRVRDRDPFPADYRVDFAAIKRVYRDAKVGECLDLIAEPDEDRAAELIRLCGELKQYSVAAKAAEIDFEAAKARLLEAVGETETVVLPGGISISAQTRVVAGGTIERKGYAFRDLRVKHPKKKETKE